MHELEDKIDLAKDKKAAFGPDIPLYDYCMDGECHLPIEKLMVHPVQASFQINRPF